MLIKNVTKDSLVADSVEVCRSWWEQTRGMMFRKSVVPLLFVFPKLQRINLHSWFCPDSIDLVFLDDSWEVVELCSEWPVRSSYSSRCEFMFLLELPAGSIAQSRTYIGDVLHIVR